MMSQGELPTDHPQVSESAGSDWLAEHGDTLFSYAMAHVARRELAEDLVQDTFLAAVKSQSPFRGDSTVKTWLISILRRKIADHYRRRSEVIESEVETFRSSREHDRYFTSKGKWREPPTQWKSPPDILENHEFWTAFRSCLSKLPTPLASAFKLRELDGVGVDELCQTLSASAGNIRIRIHRARHLLRECLDRNWFGNISSKRAKSS